MEIIEQINEPCGHEHHSEHFSPRMEPWPPDGVTCRMHDGALVCSGNRHLTGDIERVRKNLEKELGLLDSWVEDQEGITGHIKALISVNGPVYRISATAGEIETRNLGLKNLHISIAAIVFQVDQKEMEKRIEDLVDRLLT